MSSIIKGLLLKWNNFQIKPFTSPKPKNFALAKCIVQWSHCLQHCFFKQKGGTFPFLLANKLFSFFFLLIESYHYLKKKKDENNPTPFHLGDKSLSVLRPCALTTVLTLCQDAPALLQVSDHSWSVLIQCGISSVSKSQSRVKEPQCSLRAGIVKRDLSPKVKQGEGWGREGILIFFLNCLF